MPPLRNWSQSNIIQPCLYGDSIDRLGNLKPAFTLGIQFIQFRPLTSLTSRCDGVKLGRAGRKMASLLLAPQPAPSRSIPLLSLSLSLSLSILPIMQIFFSTLLLFLPSFLLLLLESILFMRDGRGEHPRQKGTAIIASRHFRPDWMRFF